MDTGVIGHRRPKSRKKKKKSEKYNKECPLLIFQFEDAQRSTGGFSAESILSRCTTANLYKAILNNGNPVVIKRGLPGTRSYASQVAMNNELRLLKLLQSDKVYYAELIGFSKGCSETLLVLQCPARGSLDDVLHRADPSSPPLSLPLRIHIAFQVAKCLKFLHYRHQMVHRDVRSGNIWIDRDWNIKLANFGVAMDIPWEGKNPGRPLGTVGMLDPDWPLDGYLATKVDVFCFGVLLSEILTNRKVFEVGKVPGNLYEYTMRNVEKNHVLEVLDPRLRLVKHEVRVPREIGRIAAMCMHPICSVRPSMSDVVERLRPLSQAFPFRTM